MNSARNVLIFFSLIMLLLVGAVVFLGNPGGSKDALISPISETVTKLQLDEDALNACVDEGKFSERVKRDMAKGEELGITGTPTIIILDRQTGKTVLVAGNYPLDPLKVAIEKLLAGGVNIGDTVYEDAAAKIKLTVGQIPNIDLVADDHLRGNAQAKIALIEYSDLDCPYCAHFHGTALMLLDQFGQDLVWTFRHYPITTTHPNAFNKAQLVECANDKGGVEAFWSLVDAYYLKALQ